MLHLAALIHIEGTPNIVVIGVPHPTAMNRVLVKLKANQVRHYAWTEPDNDMGLTAIATEPLDEVSKQVMANYRVYRGGDSISSCSVMADTPTISPSSSGERAASF